jgi:LysR family transcriptional activator of nhaA
MVTAHEIRKTHGVHLVGRTEEVREEFFAITVERRITHPAVDAITGAARGRIRS